MPGRSRTPIACAHAGHAGTSTSSRSPVRAPNRHDTSSSAGRWNGLKKQGWSCFASPSFFFAEYSSRHARYSSARMHRAARSVGDATCAKARACAEVNSTGATSPVRRSGTVSTPAAALFALARAA